MKLKRKTRRKTQKQGLLKKISQLLRILVNSLYFWLVILITLVGGYVSSQYFSPRVSIYPGVSLDPYKPFSTPFIVANYGNLTIKDFHYSLTAQNMELHGGGIFKNSGGDMGDTIKAIKPERKSIVDVSRIFALPSFSIKSATIFIKFSYKPYHCFYTKKDSVSFKLYQSRLDKKYYWVEK